MALRNHSNIIKEYNTIEIKIREIISTEKDKDTKAKMENLWGKAYKNFYKEMKYVSERITIESSLITHK